MSNQLSAFCGWISGFMSMAASCWQGREMFLSPAFHSQHVLGRRGWGGAHSSVWGSRWHGCSCVGHWTHRTTHQQEVIKVQLTRKVSLVIGLCKSHHKNTGYVIQRFCQLLPLLHSDKMSLTQLLESNSDESNWGTCTEKSKFLLHNYRRVSKYLSCSSSKKPQIFLLNMYANRW